MTLQQYTSVSAQLQKTATIQPCSKQYPENITVILDPVQSVYSSTGNKKELRRYCCTRDTQTPQEEIRGYNGSRERLSTREPFSDTVGSLHVA